MLSGAQIEHILLLLKEDIKRPSNRCVVFVSPFEHYKWILYREVMMIPPGQHFKPIKPFISLDELNSPMWDNYFKDEADKKAEKELQKHKKASKRRSESVGPMKEKKSSKKKDGEPRKRSSSVSSAIPKKDESRKRKLGVDHGKTSVFNKNDEPALKKPKPRMTVAPADPKPSLDASSSKPISDNDFFDQWLRGDFDEPKSPS